jgi:hypothetical protein
VTGRPSSLHAEHRLRIAKADFLAILRRKIERLKHRNGRADVAWPDVIRERLKRLKEALR